MHRFSKLILSVALVAAALVVVPAPAGAVAPYIVTISNDATTPESFTETITLTVSLDSESDGLPIPLSITGSATPDVDYTSTATTEVVVPLGEFETEVEFAILDDDDAIEGDETIVVATDVSSDRVTQTDTVTITIDDNPRIHVKSVPDSIIEGDTGDVVLERRGRDGGTIRGSVSVVGGAAQVEGQSALGPFQAVSWGLSEQGDRSVTVRPNDDGVYGGDTSVQILVEAENQTQVTGGDRFDIDVRDDESQVRFTIDSVDANEGGSPVVVEVERLGFDGAITVPLAITADTATEGDDYRQPLETPFAITWNDGETGVKSAPAIPLLDEVFDGNADERFDVGFGTLPLGVDAGDPASVEVTILNAANDAPTAVDDPVGPVDAQSPTVIDVLDNDNDVNGHQISLVPSSGSSSGGSYECTAGVDGTCTFTPFVGFRGPTSFTYDITDRDQTSTATVSLVVGDGNVVCSVIGTAGDDDLTGDDQDETLCGLGGADTLAGEGGADTLLGGPDDDTLIISGADSLDGGEGDDLAVLTLGDDRDEVEVRDGEIVVNGEIVSFTGIERLQIDLGDGNDSIDVTPSSVAIDIVGGGRFDRLTYNSAGRDNVVESSDSIEADGVAPVTFTGIEVIETDDRRFVGTSGADDIRVNGISQDLIIDLLDSGDLLTVTFGALNGLLTVQDTGASGTDELVIVNDDSSSEILVTSSSVVIGEEQVNHDGIELVDVLGTGGDDTITVEAEGLAAAASTPIVVVDGGTGTDTLIVDAGTRDASVDLNGGVVNVDGKAPISFTRVEFVQVRSSSTPIPVTPTSGYWMLERNGELYEFGAAAALEAVPVNGDAVDLAPTADGGGVWVLDSRGGVYARGTATFFGSAVDVALDAGETFEAIVATPSGQGYWIFTSIGRVLVFGDAVDHGDLLALTLNGAIIDAAVTVSGNGYWMLGSDGGVFSFGDAEFYGSTGDIQLTQPAVGLVPDPDGVGYWFVASDGGVFAYQAAFLGSQGSQPLNQPVQGMIPYGNGYLLVAADGGVFVYSDLPFVGSLGATPPANPILGIAATVTP